MYHLFTDYEPDYDAMWQEFVDLDEQAIFYATHELESDPMTEDHKPLPVAGYTAQPDAKVALVNEFKIDEERLLRKLDWLTAQHPMDANKADQRWLAIARTDFQRAYMALNRAVFQPQRIALPEDKDQP